MVENNMLGAPIYRSGASELNNISAQKDPQLIKHGNFRAKALPLFDDMALINCNKPGFSSYLWLVYDGSKGWLGCLLAPENDVGAITFLDYEDRLIITPRVSGYGTNSGPWYLCNAS